MLSNFPTEKTKNPEQIDVYTVQQKGVRKRVIKTTLSAFWKQDSVIRINNVDDKQETPNSEKDIRSKVINYNQIVRYESTLAYVPMQKKIDTLSVHS